MSSSQQQQLPYKEAKEAFVSQLQGGSIARINAVSLTALTTYTLWAVLRNRGVVFGSEDGRHTSRRRESTGIQVWATEVAVLVVPIILACTVLASRLIILNAVLLAVSVYVLACHPPELDQRSQKSRADGGTKKQHWSQQSDDEEEEDEERERLSSLDDAEKRRQRVEAAKEQSDSIQAEESLSPPPLEPFRVSVDSAAEAAYAAAAPPTRFVAPGEAGNEPNGASTSSQGLRISHRSSPSLERFAEPLLAQNVRAATDSAYVPHAQPFLTVYRAHMMLMTVICILAVDFPAFPREFAKCETWGTSLMDLGVGSFVYSLGIISALPMLRTPSQRFKPMRLQLLRDARRSVPLLVLGMMRVVMVKGVEYPEHVSEYGVHWNFFFTLAVLPFCGTLARPIARTARFATVGLLLTGSHQALLSLTGLGAWASSNIVARTTLVSQNKEGLTSLPGYLAIFLLGLDIGFYILPRDPYLAFRRPTVSRQREKTDKLAMVLVSYSVLWWGAYYGLALATSGQVSRRLANMPYVLWVAAYNTSFLLAYVLIYLVLLQPLNGEKGQRDQNAVSAKGKQRATPNNLTYDEATETNGPMRAAGDDGNNCKRQTSPRFDSKTPAILQALNANAFAVFMLANLLTGAVNLSMQTMYASDFTALIVLVTYVSVCAAIASFAHTKGWRLKM